MFRTRLSLVFVVVALVGCSPAISTPILDPALGRVGDPAVRHGTLENGLTYIVRANAEPRERAELRLVLDVGSILEDDDQRGLAHMVEHMAFNGTHGFERQEIVSYLESIGMRFGPDVNAYTSFDETVYMLTLPTDTEAPLETGIRILREWATDIAFDSAQVEQERGVVIEEWRLRQGAASRIQNLQFPTVTRNSRYSERLPIGTIESLEGFRHDALRRFYDEWYRPELMAVVAVGDFDPDRVEAMIRESFETIPPSPDPHTRPVYSVPWHAETMVSIATDPELTAGGVAVYLKKPPEVWTTIGDVRQWVVEWLAGAMFVNRLSEYSQRVDSPILDISSFQGRFIRSLSAFVLNARIPDGGTIEGVSTIMQEFERAARHGFTRSELEREKREKLRALEQRYAEVEKTSSSSYAAEYVSFFLQDGLILGSEREKALYLELVPDITLREVNAKAREWTRPANRMILVSAPEHKDVDLPTSEELVAVVTVATRGRVAPYRDAVSDAALLPEAPTPGRIVEERSISTTGVIQWTLSNGSTFYLKPTDYREDEVLFAARSPGGTSLYDEDDHIAALTAAAVVQSGGVGELSVNELRKRLAGSLAGVGADIGSTYEGLSGAASSQDLETLFQLIHLKFTAPRVDTTAFLAYQEQARATLMNRSANPDVAFRDTLRTVINRNHPRAQPLTAEVFDQLDLERSYEIYRERFGDASDFSFYLVGTFDTAQVRPLVEQYVASLPGAGRVESPRDLGIRPPSGVVRKVVRRGVEPRSLTQIVFTGPFDFSRPNVLAVQSLADVLRIRLRETLREDLGGTYGVSVIGTGTQLPVPLYQVALSFGTDPERLDEMTTALFAEIQRLREDGPLESDLQKVREMQFRARETDLRQNSFWLTQLLLYDQFGWDVGDIPATAERPDYLDAEAVREAARRYLNLENYVQVSLVPETGAGAVAVE